MKTRTLSKELVISEDAPAITKEDLKKAFLAYKPESARDFIVACLLHATTLQALKRGCFDAGPGVYLISDTYFSKKAPWHKVLCQVKKIS
jgi:hypothetical protein